MKRCPKLENKQKEDLENFIRGSKDNKEIRRSQSVLLVDEETDYGLIYRLTGYKERSVLIFRQRYLKYGLGGLEHKRKGKPKSLLSKEQREEIIAILNDTLPRNQGYDYEYWSTAILGKLIKEKYGVVYKTKKPFYLLFEEAKFSFHKPGQVYEKRDELKVQAWQEEIQPVVAEAFDDSNTIILCGDEMVLSSTTTFQKIWLKKGEYPKIEVSNNKRNKSIYGFLNIKEGKEHSFIKDWQNMHITVEVLQELRIIYPDNKILLFWDRAGWHTGSKVKEFIDGDSNIKVIHFPPYSPEENPQEHVWKAGRSAVTHNTFIPDIAETADKFVDYLNINKFSYSLCGFTARS
jgi:transposase